MFRCLAPFRLIGSSFFQLCRMLASSSTLLRKKAAILLPLLPLSFTPGDGVSFFASFAGRSFFSACVLLFVSAIIFQQARGWSPFPIPCGSFVGEASKREE